MNFVKRTIHLLLSWAEPAVRESLRREKSVSRGLRKHVRTLKELVEMAESEKDSLRSHIAKLDSQQKLDQSSLSDQQDAIRELEFEKQILEDKVKIYEQDIELMSEVIAKHIQREKASRLSAQAEAHYLERGHLDAAKQLVKPDRAKQPTA